MCKFPTSSNGLSSWPANSANLDDIRKRLRQEGYANVDAHLAGASIKADLKKRFPG